MKVKCISNQNYPSLQKGHVYEVVRHFAHPSTGKPYYTLAGMQNVSLPGQWFEEVQEPTLTFPMLQWYANIDKELRDAEMMLFGGKSKATPVQDEEARLRSMLRPRVEPGYCVCGIAKQNCDYHR